MAGSSRTQRRVLADIKKFALANGADAVGIVKMNDEWLIEGQQVRG